MSTLLGCDMLADTIWTEYIWKAERGHYEANALDTGLPIIMIDTEGHQTIKSREHYINGVVKINDPVDSSNDLEADTEVRGRGNITWWYPKRPYRIKFNEKQNLFGYTKAKSWVLLANHQDPTLMMNTITFELGRQMDFPFANHAVHVELVLNGVYEGSYVLTEQVQVGKGRVDIDEDDGFLVELDSYYDEEPKFTSANYRLPVMIKSPEDLTDTAGYNFVKDAVNELDSRLYNGFFDGSDGYRELIDLDSFVKFLLINEIVGNSEMGIPKSAYMHKDKDGKIFMGPLWDFDSGFSYSGGGTNVYFESSRYRIRQHPFFKRLFDDPVFTVRYKELWNQYYGDGTILGMTAFIDATAAKVDASQKANFTVWKWLNKPNYENEISKLKQWWQDRIEYLDGEINEY
ncbi:MAG: CotH kinase family protein [Treponema sp.]|nr:CotH kinase family protein [Treponema sp.]